MLAAQPDKPIMNVYNFQKVRNSKPRARIADQTLKDQLAQKVILPEKLSCIALDHRGLYCAGGTAQGRVYLWEARMSRRMPVAHLEG